MDDASGCMCAARSKQARKQSCQAARTMLDSHIPVLVFYDRDPCVGPCEHVL